MIRSFVVAEDGLYYVKEHHSTVSAEGWVTTQTRCNKAQGGRVLPTWVKVVTRDADGSWWAYECTPVLGPVGQYISPDGDTIEVCQAQGAVGFCAPELFNLE